tara:strand:- start:2921 stop:3157 length:237 start_codon:yes stop_codon:yes gene_type:complete
MKIDRLKIGNGWWIENTEHERKEKSDYNNTFFAKSIEEKNGLFYVEFDEMGMIPENEIHVLTIKEIERIVYLKDYEKE